MSRLKILLVIPDKGGHQYISFGIGYLSSYLKKNAKRKLEIKLADENAGDNVLKKFAEFKPDIVGITATTPQIRQAGEIAKEIKKANSGVTIVIGGIHFSTLPLETLENFPSFDLGIIGEGEETVLEFIDFGFGKNGNLLKDKLRQIKGLVFRDKFGKIVVNNPRCPISDIDRIPPPDRNLFNLNYYLSPRQLIRGFPAKRSTSILASRGCPFQCKFCASNIMSKKYRVHSIDYVLEEIDYLVNKLKIEALYFHDDLFLADKTRVSGLCDKLIEKGYQKKLIWSCQSRAELIEERTLPLLIKMRQAGCKQLEFGFESGSDRVLKFLKGQSASVKKNQMAIDVVKKADLRIFGNFMIGTVGETKKEIQKTIKFIKQNQQKIDFFQTYLTVPFPGTKVWDLCVKKNLINNTERFKDYYLFNGDNAVRCFSGSVSDSFLKNTLVDLNHLALKKISLKEKVIWFSGSFIKDPVRTGKKILNYFKA